MWTPGIAELEGPDYQSARAKSATEAAQVIERGNLLSDLRPAADSAATKMPSNVSESAISSGTFFMTSEKAEDESLSVALGARRPHSATYPHEVIM